MEGGKKKKKEVSQVQNSELGAIGPLRPPCNSKSSKIGDFLTEA